MKSVKHYCLVVLAMLPIVAIYFAAKSALNVAQIRAGNASDSDLSISSPESRGRPGEVKA